MLKFHLTANKVSDAGSQGAKNEAYDVYAAGMIDAGSAAGDTLMVVSGAEINMAKHTALWYVRG